MYVPLAELTLTKDNYSLTLIDGLTMETIVTSYGGLISRAGSMVHMGNYQDHHALKRKQNIYCAY